MMNKKWKKDLLTNELLEIWNEKIGWRMKVKCDWNWKSDGQKKRNEREVRFIDRKVLWM